MTTIDKTGWLVVPKVKLERRGSVVVAVPTGKTPPPLTASEVAAVIEEVRTRQDRGRPSD